MSSVNQPLFPLALNSSNSNMQQQCQQEHAQKQQIHQNRFMKIDEEYKQKNKSNHQNRRQKHEEEHQNTSTHASSTQWNHPSLRQPKKKIRSSRSRRLLCKRSIRSHQGTTSPGAASTWNENEWADVIFAVP